jgi:hypothetical protein
LLTKQFAQVMLSQIVMLTKDPWYAGMMVGVPCSLLLFFIELSQQRVPLFIFHCLCMGIYYAFATATKAARASVWLPTLWYIAFSVQTKMVLCSLFPPDAAYASILFCK